MGLMGTFEFDKALKSVWWLEKIYTQTMCSKRADTDWNTGTESFQKPIHLS